VNEHICEERLKSTKSMCLVISSACKKINRSHTQQHDKNNTTNKQTHQRPPPHPALNNAQRWRDNGAE